MRADAPTETQAQIAGCRKRGVPLEERTPPEPAASSPAVSTIHPAIARVFAALDSGRIRWALLRGEAELGSPGGDVDILAARGDLWRLEEAIAPLGFGRLPSHGRGTHTFFLAYDEAGDRWVKLDVVTELAFGRYQELWLEDAVGCLERRRVEAGVAVLDRRDGFWALLLHCLLDRGRFSDDSRRAVGSLANYAGATDPLAQRLESVLSRRWRPEALAALARAADWDTLQRVAPALRADWLRHQRLTGRTRLVRNAAMRRAGRVPPLRRRGQIVRVEPADAGLLAAVVDRWLFPHRRVRLDGSYAHRARTLAHATWQAALGRLVLLEQREPARASRLLDRLLGATGAPSNVFAGMTPAGATAEMWRRYLERSKG